jgi:pimeloyl-ACP methyl ester carboxylesterase
MARNGFDVWLLNNRGNYYSFESTNTTYKNGNFWAFTPEDMGTKDLVPTIKYILDNTREISVTVVGMQQGSEQLLMAASLMPNFFNKYVDLHIAISPTTNTGQGGIIGFFWYIWSFFQQLF